MAALFILSMNASAAAGGLFGPPQTVSKEAGGLNTAFGCGYSEDTFKHTADHVVRLNQVYSQAAYGSRNVWEIYGRIGISDLKISDAFHSTNALTTTAKNDFDENWKFFGTLGAKGFYPINKFFGVGAFIQGTYHFSNYTDEIAGISQAAFYVADLKIKNLWDVNFGIGLQATAPLGIKLYAGPYVYYSEAGASLDANIPGLEFGTKSVLLKNKSIAGGYFGADIPLIRRFRLNIEGQYTQRLSLGAAIAYVY